MNIMNVNDLNNLINFGWYYKMHSNIVKVAAEKSGFSETQVNKIAKYAGLPDFDESFLLLLGQKHYYFPKNKVKSYFDYLGNHNARSVYLQHVEKMENLIQRNKDTMAFSQAGRALHYLQDITQPNHIDSGNFFKKLFESIYPHVFFERSYSKPQVQQEIFDTYRPTFTMTAENFEDLFDETIEYSMKNGVPRRNNKSEWFNIAMRGIDLSIDSTKKFFEILYSKL